MQLTELAIPGVLLITLDRYDDNRGFFCERWNAPKLKALGFDVAFAQDNFSRSKPGVVRGIHYQRTPPQGKLVGVTRGAVYDVAVDLRPDSAHFGQHVGVELSDSNNRLLWIPEGCGHGFCVLGDQEADMLYKVSGQYNPAGEGGIRWDDADLAIDWPVDNPVLSPRDLALESFTDFHARVKG